MNLATGETFKHLANVDGAVEVRGEDLACLQAVLRSVLADVVEVCEEEGIDYTASGGVCLGAVRQRGFIPWDDDLDINIARKDLDRFMGGVESRFPGKYWIQTPQGSTCYALGIARIRLKGTAYRTRDDFKGEDGVFVDLFIVDDAPDNALARAVHGAVSLALGLISSSVRFFEHEDSYRSLVGGDPEAAKAVARKVRIGRLFGFRSSDAWTASWDRWNSRFQNPGSKYVSIPAGRKHYFGELYRREDFFPVSYGEFEGMRVPLPANPDAYLAALYGPGYMTPPPEADRERHVVLAFDLGDYDPRRREKEAAE